MLDFVRLLKGRYQSILNHAQDRAPINSLGKDILSSLCLSEAFLEKGDCLRRHPDLALQIAVIGPTQAGKSSVVNVLLAQEVAGVSPLAGFTTCPQGFALGMRNSDRSVIESFFHDFRRMDRAESLANPNSIYSLGLVRTEEHPNLRSCVIWDTPDFDSIHSAKYYNSLLKTIALADVILLVLSKDKYADQTVWKLLSLIETLRQPTVIFLNKISPENAPAVIQSLSGQWQHSRTDPVPPIVPARFFSEGIGPGNAGKERDQLIVDLTRAMPAVDRSQHHRICMMLLNHHWADWTEAVRQEQNLLSEWDHLVASSASGAIEIYRRDYLNHPQHFETLQRALAELLTLLEIPGVASLLMRTRELLTWPIRHLFRLGKSRSRTSGDDSRKSQETQVLYRMFDHFTIRLSDAVFSKRVEFGEFEYWWSEISSLLKSENASLSETFNQAVGIYQKEFRLEIEEAAHRLYSKLEQQPATLNGLRATRITTDAAALAIALKTGGIGIQDFVITPAALSLTSFLTESALGHYMRRVEAELKQKQLNAVTTRIFDDALDRQLKNLPARMAPGNKFNISEESLRDAEAQLHVF
ncbi:MAG: GTPase [Methylococcales bacterium]